MKKKKNMMMTKIIMTRNTMMIMMMSMMMSTMMSIMMSMMMSMMMMSMMMMSIMMTKMTCQGGYIADQQYKNTTQMVSKFHCMYYTHMQHGSYF